MMTVGEYRELPLTSLAALYEALRRKKGPVPPERVRVELALTYRVREAGTVEVGGVRYEYDEGDDSFRRWPIEEAVRPHAAHKTKAARLGRVALDGPSGAGRQWL